MRVVAIGASAGGLDACTKLLDALPNNTAMAFLLVQHLDPSHPSLLVELLAGHTAMMVLQAEDGMLVSPDHVYVIPPAVYLAVRNGALHLSAPTAPHGARLPFDFLLASLASEYGERALCVVLSGNGADGTLGLQAISSAGGVVLAQDLEEAGYDGMPRSAVATGLVDRVARIADIVDLIVDVGRPVHLPNAAVGTQLTEATASSDPIGDIIMLLRTRSHHDFSSYKRGTIERRIGRRIAVAPESTTPDRPGDRLAAYLLRLHTDATELDLLAKDLLIHVTSFFRDPAIYETLAKQVVPGLLQNRPADQPLRIWVAGCSTGEEVYSLAILFREGAEAQSGRRADDFKLQVFASDIDAAAIATAREGLYPRGIEADVSVGRLARFFSKEDDRGYRVLPELRATVVFTVQDLLVDPPFSRLDLVSCRNLMIYLGPEAQAKAISLFHFALKQGGVLLLGSAETAGVLDGRFTLINEAARLYRHVGRRRPGDLNFARVTTPATTSGLRSDHPVPALNAQPSSRRVALAELCRRAVLEWHAPAAILCNARYECLYSLGSTDHYLRVATGPATSDLLAMARGTMRGRLHSALTRAAAENTRVVVPGGRMARDGCSVPFTIDVQPLSADGEALLLVCFVDLPSTTAPTHGVPAAGDAARIAELERDLETARAELEDGARSLEASGEKQRAINEEALSVNEEYQSANEELLTSKEELQSLNEELSALNNQIQETLERQRTTANDLRNILYSTDVATLFLDRTLNIRFFTPATKALFNLIPGDVGRPLADLHSLATDAGLPTDVQAVLASLEPVEREIETPGGIWFRRRILPYRTESNGVEGVVITFTDITRRRQAAAALEDAKARAEAANLAKSRFLAAASHDLRQPLQTLTLLQGLLAKAVTGDRATGLVGRLGDTLGTMAEMLDTLLGLNQIEAGVVRANIADCRIGDLLDRLRNEFIYHAQAKGLGFRSVSCGAIIRTDPRLLEQMLRNLIANALKYTKRGGVLLGCRKRGVSLWIEVWDTGIGIPADELQAVFNEYRQIGNEARERQLGLGLGLSIVQRLSVLLEHRLTVRSRLGKGSVFAVEVARVPDAPKQGSQPSVPSKIASNGPIASSHSGRATRILLIEDDPDLRDVLRQLLRDEGHEIDVASDGHTALDMVAEQTVGPALVIADYNLPSGITGLQVVTKLREKLPDVVVIILTGDTSMETRRDVSKRGFIQLNKPVKPVELMGIVADALYREQPLAKQSVATVSAGVAVTSEAPVVFVVDDDKSVRVALRTALEADGHVVEDYSGGAAFLAAYGGSQTGRSACLLVDAAMPEMGGLDVLKQLAKAGHRLSSIVITGHGDVAMAVRAMKAGALDFIEKPVHVAELLASIARALEQSRDASALSAQHAHAVACVAGLTPRQLDIMGMVLAGHPSKNIAADLGISQRTVENHRAAIMRKTGTRSLPALARLALAAGPPDKAAS